MPNNNNLTLEDADHNNQYSKADIIGLADKGSTQEIIKDLRYNLDMHTKLRNAAVVHATFKSNRTYSFNRVIRIDWMYDSESIYGTDMYVMILTIKMKNKNEIYKIYKDIVKLVIGDSTQLIPIDIKPVITKNSRGIIKSTRCSNDKFIPNRYPSLKPVFPTQSSGGKIRVNHV